MFNIRLFPTYILLAVQQTADLVNCSGVQSAEGTQSKEAVQRMKKSFQTRIQIIIWKMDETGNEMRPETVFFVFVLAQFSVQLL